MSTSPLSPEEIRAAAGAHHELGPEYSDAVVASFLEKVDQEIAARVEQRVAASTPRTRPVGPVEPENRRALLKGFAVGVASSGAFSLLNRGGGHLFTSRVPPAVCPGGGLRRWRAVGRPAPGEPQGCAAAGAPRRRQRQLPPVDLTVMGRPSTRWSGWPGRRHRGFRIWLAMPQRPIAMITNPGLR